MGPGVTHAQQSPSARVVKTDARAALLLAGCPEPARLADSIETHRQGGVRCRAGHRSGKSSSSGFSLRSWKPPRLSWEAGS